MLFVESHLVAFGGFSDNISPFLFAYQRLLSVPILENKTLLTTPFVKKGSIFFRSQTILSLTKFD